MNKIQNNRKGLRWLTTVGLFFVVGLMFVSCVHAQGSRLDVETLKVCNQVMMNIFDEILIQKNSHEELKNFDKSALAKNQYGIPTIKYKYFDTQGYPYEFGVTILRLDDLSGYTNDPKASFNLGFPLLGLRFSGYLVRSFRSSQFDVQIPIQKQGDLLWDYQQKFIPLRLTLKAVKESFKVGEPVEFIVTLTNTTIKNLWVKDLTPNTVFFLYKNQSAGATDVDAGGQQVILKSGESISKQFRGYAFDNPQEFELYASYIMTFEGVKPANAIKIKVE